jgi:hypothetical protein
MSEQNDTLEWESWEKLPYLLSFVTSADGQCLSVHADLNGITALIEGLQELRSQLLENDCPHTHLWTHRGHGPYLTTSKLDGKDDEVHVAKMATIYGWNDEWAVRHGLRPPAPEQQDRGWSP